MDETYKSGSWDLSDILPKDFDAKCNEIRSLVNSFSRCKRKLNRSISREDLSDVFRQFNGVRYELERLYAAYDLRFSEDSSDSESSRMLFNAESFMKDMQDKISFLDDWIISLSPLGMKKVMSRAGKNCTYIKKTARGKRFNLDDNVEKIFSLKESTSADLRCKVYEQIVSSFRYPILIDGVKRRIPNKEMILRRSSQDALVRADADERWHMKHASSQALAELYVATAKDWHNEYVKVRKYHSPMSVVNFENELSDEVVEALLDSCRRNVGLFQRYFKAKAKLLGFEKLRFSDILAPAAKSSNQYKFHEAIGLVL